MPARRRCRHYCGCTHSATESVGYVDRSQAVVRGGQSLYIRPNLHANRTQEKEEKCAATLLRIAPAGAAVRTCPLRHVRHMPMGPAWLRDWNRERGVQTYTLLHHEQRHQVRNNDEPLVPS